MSGSLLDSHRSARTSNYNNSGNLNNTGSSFTTVRPITHY